MGVCFGHGIILAVGWAGTIITSTNGVDWTNHLMGTLNDLGGVAYGQGTFVAVGESGTILQSGQLPSYDVLLWPIVKMPDGTIVLTATGPLDTTWTIQVSTNLADWATFSEFTGTNSTIRLTDSGALDYSQRFYRGMAW